MTRNRSRQLIVIDPETGQQIVVQQPDQQHRPLMQYEFPTQPQHYPPPMLANPAPVPARRPRRKRRRGVSPRERERREHTASFAGTFFAMFILSWVPCGFGMPGATLLAWGLLAAYTFYRACR